MRMTSVAKVCKHNMLSVSKLLTWAMVFLYIVVIQKDQVLRGTGNCQKVVKYNNLVPN